MGYTCFSHPVESCGVVAAYVEDGDCIDWVEAGLFEQRHRGQEAWGTSVCSDHIETRKYPGMVPEDNEQMPDGHRIPGKMGTGHVRYGTTGDSGMCNAQPILIDGRFTIAHNGTICNARQIREYLIGKGKSFATETDTELVGHLIAEGDDIIDGYKHASEMMKGSWCLVLLDKDGIYAMRDPHGFKPLVLGKVRDKKNYVVASEPGVFSVLGLDFLRDVNPGEIIHIDDKGNMHGDAIERRENAYCAFCRVYFARPDSVIDTTPVGMVRTKLGANLAEAGRVKADFSQGIPDSGVLYAQGAHSKTGEPLGTVILRKRHHRTFILPGDRLAKSRGKYIILPFNANQSGIFYDDSIVRGNTLRGLVRRLREEGHLREVHIRVGSPPINHPCPYGIDMQTKREFAIVEHGDVEGIRKFIGADSLVYQTEDGFFDGLGISGIPPEQWCTACWGIGKYPVDVPDDFARL